MAKYLCLSAVCLLCVCLLSLLLLYMYGVCVCVGRRCNKQQTTHNKMQQKEISEYKVVFNTFR
jgi:hypothetical protein